MRALPRPLLRGPLLPALPRWSRPLSSSRAEPPTASRPPEAESTSEGVAAPSFPMRSELETMEDERALYLLAPVMVEVEGGFEWQATKTIEKHEIIALVPKKSIWSKVSGYQEGLLPQRGLFIRDVLSGYENVRAKDPRRFDLMEMALLSFFAVRTGSPIGDWLHTCLQKSQPLAKSSLNEKFFRVLAKSLVEDLAPIVEIVDEAVRKALAEKRGADEEASPLQTPTPMSFEDELERCYHLALTSSFDLADSNGLPRTWRRHGHAVLVPGFSTLAHDANANALVTVPRLGLTPPLLVESWAKAMNSPGDSEFLDSSLVLVATRTIEAGEPIRRDYGYRSPERARLVFGVELPSSTSPSDAEDAANSSGTTVDSIISSKQSASMAFEKDNNVPLSIAQSSSVKALKSATAKSKLPPGYRDDENKTSAEFKTFSSARALELLNAPTVEDDELHEENRPEEEYKPPASGRFARPSASLTRAASKEREGRFEKRVARPEYRQDRGVDDSFRGRSFSGKNDYDDAPPPRLGQGYPPRFSRRSFDAERARGGAPPNVASYQRRDYFREKNEFDDAASPRFGQGPFRPRRFSPSSESAQPIRGGVPFGLRRPSLSSSSSAPSRSGEISSNPSAGGRSGSSSFTPNFAVRLNPPRASLSRPASPPFPRAGSR